MVIERPLLSLFEQLPVYRGPGFVATANGYRYTSHQGVVVAGGKNARAVRPPELIRKNNLRNLTILMPDPAYRAVIDRHPLFVDKRALLRRKRSRAVG